MGRAHLRGTCGGRSPPGKHGELVVPERQEAVPWFPFLCLFLLCLRVVMHRILKSSTNNLTTLKFRYFES